MLAMAAILAASICVLVVLTCVVLVIIKVEWRKRARAEAERARQTGLGTEAEVGALGLAPGNLYRANEESGVGLPLSKVRQTPFPCATIPSFTLESRLCNHSCAAVLFPCTATCTATPVTCTLVSRDYFISFPLCTVSIHSNSCRSMRRLYHAWQPSQPQLLRTVKVQKQPAWLHLLRVCGTAQQ